MLIHPRSLASAVVAAHLCVACAKMAPPPEDPGAQPPPPATAPQTAQPTQAAPDGSIPAGSKLLVQTVHAIDSRKQAPGSRFDVVLQGGLQAGGAMIVPAGTKAFGTIVAAKKSGRLLGKADLTITLTEITIEGTLLPLRTSGVQAVGQGKGGKTAKKVLAGAAIGAMFGGGKGAAYGAAAGATAALLLQGDQINIPAGTLLEFTLAEPVMPPGGSKPEATSLADLDPASLSIALAKVQAEQESALIQYNWNQRTELVRAGKSKLVRLELIRFDSEGEVQRTVLSEEPKGSPSDRKLIEDVRGLRDYAYFSSGRLLDFLQSAERSSAGGKLIAIGKNVRAKGDSVRMTIDEKARAVERVEVETKLGADAVRASIEYRLPGEQPGAPIRAKVEVLGKKTQVSIEAFSFSRG